MDRGMLKMCRCCLVMDVKMSYVISNDILDLFTRQELPGGWVCYKCSDTLRKVSAFRQVCLSSESWLLHLLQTGAMGQSTLNDEDETRRKDLHRSAIQTLGSPSTSNTLAISVLTELALNNTSSNDYENSRINVWSFVSRESERTNQRNYSQGMEEWEREQRNKIQDVVLPFVKVECGDDDKLIDGNTSNSIKINNLDDDLYFNNDHIDHGSDTDDESFNVPLINVAMMAANSNDAKQLKDEKTNDIKMEDEVNDGEGADIKCKYCWETFSKASYLPGHYRVCSERKSKHSKRGGGRRQRGEGAGGEEGVQVTDGIIKMEPEELNEGDTLLCDIISLGDNDVVKVKKKKKKKGKKSGEVEGGQGYCCEVCCKTFVKQSQLQRHARIHTGERPYKCDFSQCDYSSSRADDLKKHKRKHTGDRPYACAVEGCHFKSSYAHHLNRHMRAHTGTKEYMCDTCGKKFRESSVLKQHQLSAHSLVKPYACEECDYTTAYPNLLKDHQAQSHRPDGGSGKNYVCDECGHSYWRADQLKVHKRVHSGEKPFRCDVCSFATSHSNALKVHKRSHSNERPYVCEECAHAFARKDDLKTHMRIHSGDRPYACDRCPYTAAQKSNLKRHKISHLGIKPFCCDECGKRFAEASSLKMHKRLHAGVRPFKCPHCPYSTSQSGGLKRHLVSHSGEKPFVCHVCGKAFTLIYDLNNHSRIHTGEKPYSCDLCNFATSHHNALKIHKRSHTGEKPFRCDTCGVCFSRGGDLKTHKRIHTGEKPYACTVCCYTATQASNLKRHMISHSGKKPFTCGDCGKSFTEAGTLRIHRRTHTGERPYCCHHCAQAFSQAGHLRKHMRLHANTTNNAAMPTANQTNNTNADVNTTLVINASNVLNNTTANTNAVLIANVFKTEINNTSHVNINNSEISKSMNIVNNINGVETLESTNRDSVSDGAVSHRCHDCGQSFSQMQQLTKHMTSVHLSKDVDDDKSNIILQLTISPNNAACQ